MGHAVLVLRPRAVVLDGVWTEGLQVELCDGLVSAIRPYDGVSEDWVLSPAFVNAHSHFEYRGFQGKVDAEGYWAWLRRLTVLKTEQTEAAVRKDCLLASRENREGGVGFVAEHSDRPFSGEAMAAFGLLGNVYQEVITIREAADPSEKLASIQAKATRNRQYVPTVLSPHAPWTVDPVTLAALGRSNGPLSIHVAESDFENEFFSSGSGAIGEIVDRGNLPEGKSAVDYLRRMGFLRPGVQFVHCCDLSTSDVQLLADSGVSVAHCPRSNVHLGCPAAPVREMLDAGVRVGLGMDSAASGGPIDMFDEMRSALDVASSRGKALEPEEVWKMATTMGASSLGWDKASLRVGNRVSLIRLDIPSSRCVGDVIEGGTAGSVSWICHE